MGKSVWRSIEYFFTGNYTADDGNNDIDAYGLGGVIHAYGGDDTIRVGSIGATVYTGTGNDSVYGGAAYLKVVDDSGNLTVKGAAGYADISKSQSGNVHFAGASGATNIDHQGRDGDIRYQGAALANFLTRKGISGNVSFEGAGGYNRLWHQTDRGDLSYSGAGAANKLDRTWHSQYQGSQGNIHFSGAGAANIISSQVESGNVTMNGAGAYNKVFRKGREGDVNFNGAGGWNELSRLRNEQDEYQQTRGDIRFNGAGGYNRLLSDVAEGNIHFKGAGGYNHLSRKGSDSDSSPFAGARADEIALTTATMGGSWINQSQAVTAIKSTLQPNTYLFAFFDGMYTKINRVELSNDGASGALCYHATSWYKEGNHLNGLAGRQIDAGNGFVSTQTDGAYRLSDLVFERRQRIKLEAVEADLTENSWINYGGRVNVAAADVTLSSAKMSGYAIFEDGTKVDVSALKSRVQANTYVFAKQLGPYTKIVVVELANDRETGALKYLAKAWYKEGNHLAGLADQVISERTGFTAMGTGGYSLSEVRYQLNTVTAVSDRLPATREFSSQLLLPRQQSGGKSKGDIFFDGAGGGNVIESDATEGNIHFNGAGAANVLIKRGKLGDLVFRGAGLANVLVHQGSQGRMDVYATGVANVLVRIGDGEYLARLLAYGNISVQKGRGDSQVIMLGGYNTHTQIGSGKGLWLAAGGFNVMTQVGQGNVVSVLAGGANVLTKIGDGELTAGMLGGANLVTHISGDAAASNTTVVALGSANILTKKGKGNTLAVMGGGANVLTHVGDGTTTGVMVGGANILTKVGNGDTTGIMLGVGNVLTHIGDGQTLGVMGAAGNIFTKVGDGTSIAVMIGTGNIFTHVGEANAWALMGGLGNVFTKVGNGDALALMVAEANVFTHIGDGMSVALMLARGNVATKVGNGTTLAAMVGNANIFTHVGNGSTFAAMIGQANVMTHVGNDLTAALLIGKANIMTHVGNGTSTGLFAGEVNVMTKVGNGTTLAAMFGKANIMTHVGDGLTGVLALGEANIVTKVGNDFMGVVAAAKANVVTHVGDATTAAVLAGKGNILTKVGRGTTVGLLISDVGNVMTHVGDGTTIGIAKGKANIITKVGDGLGVNVAWGQANVLTHVGDGDRYNLAKGEANIITKVGDGQEVSVVQGQANIVTHVGNGDDYTGAWGKANVITKVGNGRNVVLAKGEANIVTQVGQGDSFNALWSKGNIVTKVGDGMQVTAAKGQANITTTVGNGLSVTAAYGDANINTKIGDGVSVNVAWGKYNLNTKVGDGLNVAVMKGKANANIHVGDGLNINASYAQNNLVINVGNGDFYSLAVASSNTSSNTLSALFNNIKQTVLGVGGSQAINYLVQGDEASSSGTHKGRGAIATPEITRLDGFHMDAINEVGPDLSHSLKGSVTNVDTPDLNEMQNALNVDNASAQAPNLIVNGDFESGDQGWQSTHGVEASHAGSVYGVDGEGHGAHVTELDVFNNTSIYQELNNLAQGEVIAVSFDFAKRAGISNNEGIEVLWNGGVVFSSSGDDSVWQQKTLKLTAHAGSNRIEFKGTGHNDGAGYILDNVVAKSESSQQANAVSEHATQNQAAQNALSDKERAEADRQRLEQEKQKQLDAVAGSKSQLEATDQQALANNGQAQHEAVKEESNAVTTELTQLAQGLDVLDSQTMHTSDSGEQWRNDFAGGLLAGVQTQLDNAKQVSGEQMDAAKQTQAGNNRKVEASVAQSKVAKAKGAQNIVRAEQDVANAQINAEKRKSDALVKSNDAKQAESDAHNVVNNAQSRGESDVQAAENKANQAQTDAKGAKQSEDYRPYRQGMTGSGLSGNQHRVEGAGETASHVNADAQDNADSRFSQGLTDQEQEALEGAINAVNRLQIGAGIRGENPRSTSMLVEPNDNRIVMPTIEPQDVARNVADAQPNIMKGGLLQNIGYKIFDLKAGSKVLEMSSFHFSQGADLLEPLTTLIREVGNVLITNGNDAQSKEFLEGVCFALSARYMIEERVHGLGGGRAYMKWLKDTVQAYNDNTTHIKTDIGTIEQKLLNQYRRQNLGLAVKDLLSMQYSQSMNTLTAVERDAANKEYGGKLKANGLTGPNINDALSYGADGYESVMDKLRNVKKSTYMSFMSQGHAMSVVVHKKGNFTTWSFYDPNFGAKSFAQYDDFRGFMDNFHKGLLTQYKFQKSEEASQSFYVKFNKFEEGEISYYDGSWKDARDGEQAYVLRALKEQGITFKLNEQLTGKVIGVEDGKISLELTTKIGSQLVVEVEVEQFSEAVKLVQSNARRLIEHLGSKKVSLQRNNFEDVIEPALYDEKNGDDKGASSEGKVQKIYQSRDLVLPPLLQRETIELGMPEIDQKILAEVAERENLIIGVRPVDEKSKSLIESKMYSSKGLFVKAKSSDWGPMSGFIPVDQSFAKASARRELEKFNGYAEQSIVAGNAVAADLYLNQTRVDELVSKYHSLTPLVLDAASGMYTTTATNGDQTVPFFLNKVTVDGKELWQVHYIKDGELARFKVIGDPVSKQPMTADYDLLTVLYPYADLGPQDKTKSPLTWEQWKESVIYEDLTPKNKEFYNSKELYDKNDGASLGIVSDRVRKLKDVININLGRTNGLEMVHHGADDANPYAVMADNFPATFFVPKHFFTEDGLGEGKGSIKTYFNVNEQGAVVIRNPQEFYNFEQVAINVSYRASPNDKWNNGLNNPIFTLKRQLSHDYLDARDQIARQFGCEPSDFYKNSELNNDNEKLGLGDDQGSKVVHTIDSLQPSEILDEVIRDLNKSSTLMSETNFYDPKRFESDSARVRAEWKQTLTNINNIRQMYFPHDMARYFEALKSYKVGNCGDRALYAAHLIMDKYNFQGEVELLKLKGSGDHVFVRVGGTSDAAKIIDPWTGQHFAYSQIENFLYNPKGKKVEVHRSFDELKTLFKDLHKTSLSSATNAKNSNVENWKRAGVTPQAEGGQTRFNGQVIIQMEDDAEVARAAANLAGKHPDNSVVVQLDSDCNYRVVYGDPSKLDGTLRWQLVGHGRSGSENNNTSFGGYNADELAVTLAKFRLAFNQAENIRSKPDHVSIVGCSLVSDDKQKGFGHRFINEMNASGLRVDVSVRSTSVQVLTDGRKSTKNADGNWVHKGNNNKVLLSWNEQGAVTTNNFYVRNGIAEDEIDLARVGINVNDESALGAIGDNREVFDAPERRRMQTDIASSSANNTQLSYSGNIQVNVGDGEFTAVNWGTSNVGIKVGTGGFKSLAFGDNNIMIHIGNGDSKHSFDIGGYQALEGAQMFIGNRNVSFNLGRSNDLIVMMDKSIPTPPLVNPFDGAARISGVLQSIVTSGKGQNWLAAQEQQWSLSGAKKFVRDMSGLDLSSSVDYSSLVELNSQHERSSRGLKHDTEATLNKQFNQWLSDNGNTDSSQLSRADKLRQANEKLAFNFAVGGQGADIQVTTGNWNFMFGDNIQSILDTNLGSLFGLMTQQFSATGQAKTTFTYTPQDLPRQLTNKLLGQLAGVGAETTLADIFGVDYTTSGRLVARNGEDVDGVAILKEMLEVIGKFSGDKLQAFVDPAKLLDSLKSGIDMGADGIKSFAETHGLKEKEPEEKDDETSVSVNGASGKHAQSGDDTSTSNAAAAQERAFGFNALNLPNLFATIFSQDKQKEMATLVENLKQNLTADLLNMKEKTFDFLRNSGHLQGDGDINLSLGNYNFNWGGDGKDLGSYLGDNNNFWGGRGDDVFYTTGTSNIFTGGAGQDSGVMMGRENMMFGGQGDDVAVLAGRINRAFMGEGNDQAFIFGEGGIVEGGTGQDYLVTSGNYNQIDAGVGQDFTVTIGNHNQIQLGEGDDVAMVFGNNNRLLAEHGNNQVKLMGYHATIRGGDGRDQLSADQVAKFSQLDGYAGDDLLVLGGYQNQFRGGTGVDSFVFSGAVIENVVQDIGKDDFIVLNDVSWRDLWFKRSGYDLELLVNRRTDGTSEQGKFEQLGRATFSNYFADNRAQLVIELGEQQTDGERSYTALSHQAVDLLVQAMSSFAPEAGDMGLLNSLDNQANSMVHIAWSDVSNGRARVA